MSDTDRTISPARRAEDAAEASLRPQTLAEFIGRKASRENLAVFTRITVASSRRRTGAALAGSGGANPSRLRGTPRRDVEPQMNANERK